MRIACRKTDPKLLKLLEEAIAKFEAMTPEEQEAHRDAQRKGWVKAEMAWPRDCPYR